jgi:hypothetical protein
LIEALCGHNPRLVINLLFHLLRSSPFVFGGQIAHRLNTERIAFPAKDTKRGVARRG